MRDDNWDIGAVVRSCNINRTNNVVFPYLGSKTFENNHENSFERSLAADITKFNVLPELFSLDFPVAHPKKPDHQFFEIINCTNHVPIIADQVKIVHKNKNQQLLQPIHSAQFGQQSFLPPPPAAITCIPITVATPLEWIDMQQQLMKQANIYPTINLPMRTSLIQNRKRKNQQTRVIYELLQEELTNDTWTWRKYGQKTIKGSPFPRNYYRCSTSKLCEAKKQIEKSPNNEDFFLVAYLGEHNHDPPTNCNSLTRCNDSSKYNLPRGINIVPKALSLKASSSSSKPAKCSRAAASPISPTIPTLEIISASENKNEMVVAVEENKGNGEDKENINEDVLMGLEVLHRVTAST